MSIANKISLWIKPYVELVKDGDKIFCRACSKLVSCERKYLIDQHAKAPSHIGKCEELKRSTCVQQPIYQCVGVASTSRNSEQAEYDTDLCNALVSSNIPLATLNNINLKSFLQKYCKHNTSDESALRKNYITSCYQQTMAELQPLVGNNFIYIMVDESTDKCGRYSAHLLIGILHEDIEGRQSVYGSKWFAWESLKFLDDAEELCAISNSTPENKVWEDNADIEQKNRELIDETGEDDSQENSHSDKTLVSSPKKRILSHKIPLLRRRCTEGGRIRRRHNISVNTSVTAKKDECAMFGEFIAEKMRNLNGRSRAILQHQIHTLILQMEIGNQVLLQPTQPSQQIISLASPNPSQTPSTSYHSPSILPNPSSSHSSLPQHYNHILQQNNDDTTIKVEDSVIL